MVVKGLTLWPVFFLLLKQFRRQFRVVPLYVWANMMKDNGNFISRRPHHLEQNDMTRSEHPVKQSSDDDKWRRSFFPNFKLPKKGNFFLHFLTLLFNLKTENDAITHPCRPDSNTSTLSDFGSDRVEKECTNFRSLFSYTVIWI